MLVVEGDETALKALVLLLGRAGHEVMGAATLEAARETLHRESYDAVVVDLELPGRQWREIIELAGGTEESGHPRLVGISARAASAHRGEVDQLDALLRKPLDLRALYGLLGPGALERS
ncbi:MAG: response regulator [Thermoanaerobaculia bacterium]